MSSGATIGFNDPRRFGSMKIVPRAQLDRGAAVALARARAARQCVRRRDAGAACEGKKTSLKAALLDQRMVAGLGNIYVCEALNRVADFAQAQGLDHRDRSRRAERARAGCWSMRSRRCSNDAIEAGGSSLRDHRRTDGELGDFQHNFRVYDREGKPCPTRGCKGTIKRIVQNGRSTFFCPVCQK